ncbi:hypothetical protein EW145_g5349 [Phellinidium pouzarii]|uniref:Major facilitator superfamily (MFS) profile domain-containing protein n=1 Tax=Phellinidium pouzarii TaxID=167371 RepID=A0A4V3XC67_9AGAM|nr:hypothetical protein EW145_g5349 [Phellinidium pouzarii]
MPGLGILPDHYLEDIPGTSLLYDLHSPGAKLAKLSGVQLKRAKNGIILVPQPSELAVLAEGCAYDDHFIRSGHQNLDTSVAALSKITGDLVLSIGLVLILTAPASVIWGRRPVFLIGNALLLTSAIWSAATNDLGSLTASRVIGGIGGICGASIVNGYLIQDASWRLCFIIEAVLCGALFILTVLFVPETAYIRPEIYTSSELIRRRDEKNTAEIDKLGKVDAEEEAFAEDKTADIYPVNEAVVRPPLFRGQRHQGFALSVHTPT